MAKIQLFGKNEILAYLYTEKIQSIVEEDSTLDVFCDYIKRIFKKMPEGKRLDMILTCNIRRCLEFFYSKILGGSMDDIGWKESNTDGFYIEADDNREQYLNPAQIVIFLDALCDEHNEYEIKRSEYIQNLYIWLERNGHGELYLDREVKS